jgi:CubicO group peptidase (beta-lactamase class C family)
LDWEKASEEKLYRPLGMTSTSSRYADFTARKNKALGHVLVDGKWAQKFKRDPDAQSPAGGASSSVNDVAKWMRLQLANGKFDGKQIVDEKALLETHHPHMLTGFNPFTGLFSNPAAVGTVLGFDYSKPPASPAPALKNRAYVGRFTNDYFGDVSVVEKDGGLAIVEGPKNKTFPMQHYDRDTFTYETTDENAVGRSGIAFTIGADGKATQVVVENLNVRGEGVFKRVSDQK